MAHLYARLGGTSYCIILQLCLKLYSLMSKVTEITIRIVFTSCQLPLYRGLLDAYTLCI